MKPNRRAPALVALVAFLGTGTAAVSPARADDNALILGANMKVLNAKLPEAANRYAGSNLPGQIFLPGEPVDVKLVLSRGPTPPARPTSPSRSARCRPHAGA